MMGQTVLQVVSPGSGVRGTVGRKRPGDGLGECALQGAQKAGSGGDGSGGGAKAKRQVAAKYEETVVATEPCILATLWRTDYDRLMKMADIRASTVIAYCICFLLCSHNTKTPFCFLPITRLIQQLSCPSFEQINRSKSTGLS
eukprot:SAG22_NODE_280_length_13084_cov_3.480209_6_plen_143_part_00